MYYLSKHKKLLLLLPLVLILLVLALTGFHKRTDIYLGEFSASEDGALMRVRVNVGTSMGYIRSCSYKNDGDALNVTFYSTFGGLNSSFGAKEVFMLELNGARQVRFQRDDGFYTVARIDESGEWTKVQ